MHLTTATLLVAFYFGQLPVGQNDPTEAVQVSYKDVLSLPIGIRPYVRYLSLYNIPPKDRDLAWRVLAGHVNGLSTEPDLVAPIRLDQGALLRINISDYGWDAKVWEQLAEADPYFHAKLEAKDEFVETVKHYTDGTVETIREKKTVSKQITAAAPWLDAQAIAGLVSLTQSKAPIVRGDWFFSQTAIQADRKPGYYDFIGVKNRADFQRLVGFNAKLAAESKRKELLEAVSDSGITQQPRRIGRFEAIGSQAYWRTFDNRRATDEHNPLRVLDSENFKFDASEEFGALPNHLWATGLFAADGTRQDSAPDFIASDATSKSNDRRVHVNLSCIRCHGPHAGMQPIEGWVRNLIQAPLALQSPDYEVLKDLRQKYLRNLSEPQEDDRRAYTRALREATGMKPADYAPAYADFWSQYEDQRIDADRAALELGTTKQALLASIDAYIRKTGTIDTVLSVLLRGGTIGRRQIEEVYGTAHLVLRGIVQP